MGTKIWYFIHHTIHTPASGFHCFAASLHAHISRERAGSRRNVRHKDKLGPDGAQHVEVEPEAEVPARAGA